MEGNQGKLLARCVVCRGDIHEGEKHEIWEDGYYCRRHSLVFLRERARLYAASLTERVSKKTP
jgi:hypothetical protein